MTLAARCDSHPCVFCRHAGLVRGEPNEADIMRPQERVHRLDGEIGELATRQHGVVQHEQLLRLGLGARGIRHRVSSGRLHRIHRGVYAVGHRRLTRQGWWMAAVLAGGEGAALSHRPAGAAHGLRAWSGRPAITASGWRRSTPLIEIHASSLPADEVTVLDGIPITTVARTLLDLATLLGPAALERAVNEAEKRELGDALSVAALLERHRGERGTAALRLALDAPSFGRGVTDLRLEERFVRFIAERRLPHPELNAWIVLGDRRYRVDCLWREQRLVVELQSHAHHSTPRAMARDAERSRRLLLAGWRVIYVTWAQLHRRFEADALAADLRRVLSPM